MTKDKQIYPVLCILCTTLEAKILYFVLKKNKLKKMFKYCGDGLVKRACIVGFVAFIQPILLLSDLIY